jgi:hypothetical protein
LAPHYNRGRRIRKEILLFALAILLAGQAYGAALCVSLCSQIHESSGVSSQNSNGHCHQAQVNSPKSVREGEVDSKLPSDCNIMSLLTASPALSVSDIQFELTTPRAKGFSSLNAWIETQLFSFTASILLTDNIHWSPPGRSVPLYSLMQKFLI